ncbi:CoA transferase subunit A [Bacillus sp. BRMEA1]|nr:CoA transferase subunit A [Neobacillus endophyticus]
MAEIISIEKAVNLVEDGMTVMIGGFLGVGAPENLIAALIEKDVKSLTIITNDTAFPNKGAGKLIVNKQARKVIASHIGTNPEAGRQMNSNELEVTLIPQGTLAEQIRCAGSGLGGILTPTGIGTEVEKGKQILLVENQEYLLETPIRADVALIRGSIVDKAGNVFYNYSTRNFNPLMAAAADLVIVGAEKIVETGDLDPNMVMTPGIFVDYIVGGEK